ncbi:winged helix-turn-helix transcriptional regulator [Cellulomonas hominis]
MHTLDDDASPDVPGAYADGYPARAVLDRISDRWSIAVMRALQMDSPLRYSELEQRLPGVSRKMLTQTLRAIERDGMVRRTVYPEVPPRVEYAVTELGLSSLGPIDVLCDWSRRYMREVLEARRRFDACRADGRAYAKLAASMTKR